MISIVPVRFMTNTDANSVWSEDVFKKWMQPLIPFSLGDFWWSSGKGLFPLDCTVYAPIVVDDPRVNVAKDNDSQRGALVNGAIAAATTQVNPDWDNTDILMLWYAQPTDMFGGGAYEVPLRGGGSKTIPVTVVDIASPFDAACQELGHSFGLEHELDDAGRDYASPYSVMSARARIPEFLRSADPRLPDGQKVADPRDLFFNEPAQHIVGPALTAAQLFRIDAFKDSPQVIQLSRSYAQQPATLTLFALNYTVREPPGPLPVLATFPSNRGDGRIFTLEFRRGGLGYDTAIGTPGAPAGLVVHSINPDGRVRYEGVAAVSLAALSEDWASNAGDFSLRLIHVDPANEFVQFSLRGDAAVPRAVIAWVNATDGTMQLWVMNSGRVLSRLTVVAENGTPERSGAPWHIVGTGDFNGDGKTDFLWVNVSDQTMQIWGMNGGRVQSRMTVVAENGSPEHSAAPWHIVGTGDFTGDGKADILWVNVSDGSMQIWAMDGGRVTGRLTVVAENGKPEHSAAPWHIVGTGDFTGNGKADILWVNASDRTMQIWAMDGGRVTGRVTVAAENGTPEHSAPPWTIVRVGDFNRDGKADILWLNTSDRTMQIWMMDGGRVANRVTVVAENSTSEHSLPPWSIVGSGNRNPDILWHNSASGEIQLWFMDGHKVRTRATVLGEEGNAAHIGPPWSVVASGDFNVDGSADILWHNSATGGIELWFMNGHRVSSRATVVGEQGTPVNIGPPWRIVASSDFNVDGGADILWHNSATGEIQLWFMNGHRVRSRATVLAEQDKAIAIGPPWSIVASSDFSVDGSSDILWHNSASGEVQLWFLNGHRIRSRATVVGEDGKAVHIGPPWKIVKSGDFDLDGCSDILWHNGATGEIQLWFMNGHRVRSRATVLGEDGNAVHVGPPWSIRG